MILWICIGLLVWTIVSVCYFIYALGRKGCKRTIIDEIGDILLGPPSLVIAMILGIVLHPKEVWKDILKFCERFESKDKLLNELREIDDTASPFLIKMFTNNEFVHYIKRQQFYTKMSGYYSDPYEIDQIMSRLEKNNFIEFHCIDGDRKIFDGIRLTEKGKKYFRLAKID